MLIIWTCFKSVKSHGVHGSHRGYGIFSDYFMMLLFTCACVEGHIRVGRHLEKE